MNHGIWVHPSAGTAAELVELGVLAEASGWDGVFVSDHLGGYPDPFTVLSGIAGRTDAVRLGTWVTPLARRQPWQVASVLATLDELSGGRMLFGAGLGTEDDWTSYGRTFDAPEVAAQLDESLDILDGLWRHETFSYDGDHFTVDEATLGASVVQEPRIPILLAGWWPNKRPIARGARWDGIMPVPPNYPTQFTEPELRELLSFYRSQTDDPGDVLLGTGYDDESPEFPTWCDELGVTWLLTTGNDGEREGVGIDDALVRAGPPSV